MFPDELKTASQYVFNAGRAGRPRTLEYLVQPNAGTTTAQISATKGICYLSPLDVYYTQTFTAIGIGMTIAATGAGLLTRIGLYPDAGDGSRPSVTSLPVVDAGTFDPTGATGDQVVAFATPTQLTPGRYWTATVLRGTTYTTQPTYVAITALTTFPTLTLANSNFRQWYATFGAADAPLAALASITGYTATLPFLIGLRAQ